MAYGHSSARFWLPVLLSLGTWGGTPILADEAAGTNWVQTAVEWVDARCDVGLRAVWLNSVRQVDLQPELIDRIPASQLPASTAWRSELRPDLSAHVGDHIVLGLKPRARYTLSEWDDGARDGESEDDTDVFINEGFAELGLLNDELFVGYARENLQWGPAFLTSPSNPFNSENGRQSPQDELPGMGYAKTIWKPSWNWSLNLLANTDEGRMEFPDYTELLDQARAEATTARDEAYAEVERRLPPWNGPLVREIRGQARARIDAEYARGLAEIDARGEELEVDFVPTYAAKLDGVFDRRNFSLIGSVREGDDPRVGAFASWDASDAMRLYAEGNTDVVDYSAALAGAAYTFLDGTTLNLEYFHNGDGDPDAPMTELVPPNQPYDPRRVFYRRDYLFVQLGHTDYDRGWSLVGRWTCGLNDQSHRLVGQATYGLGDRTEVFINALADIGNDGDEFGGSLDHAVNAGFKVSL